MSAATSAASGCDAPRGGPGDRPDDRGTRTVRRGARTFLVADHPSSCDGIDAFLGDAEAATLDFFDATLPHCNRMIDLGAYVGFMSLYAATQVARVHAIEASPTHQALLRTNLLHNPELATRIHLHPVAVGDIDGRATLFSKGPADSGTSVFATIERAGLLRGCVDATVPQRAAGPLLETLGLDQASLLKIDVEGAEYAILPAVAPLLARRRPFLQVSFHPFNLVAADPYTTSLLRLRASLQVAEALAAYRYIYLPAPAPMPGTAPGATAWQRVDREGRQDFLLDYLLTPKPAARVGSLQLGFVDAVGFSPVRLPALENAITA